jgi:hypothetical protein
MVDIWFFHPKSFLNFYTFCNKEFFFGCFLAACSLKENLGMFTRDVTSGFSKSISNVSKCNFGLDSFC